MAGAVGLDLTAGADAAAGASHESPDPLIHGTVTCVQVTGERNGFCSTPVAKPARTCTPRLVTGAPMGRQDWRVPVSVASG